MAGQQTRRKRQEHAGDIEMTPMIDVVFQLLIYFLVTIKPIDVSAHLDVFRPSASAPPPEQTEPPKMIQIQVLPGAITINERSVDLPNLTTILTKLGTISKTQTVVIMCAADSEHDQLISVLDRCSRAGLVNLSVVSMD